MTSTSRASGRGQEGSTVRAALRPRPATRSPTALDLSEALWPSRSSSVRTPSSVDRSSAMTTTASARRRCIRRARLPTEAEARTATKPCDVASSAVGPAPPEPRRGGGGGAAAWPAASSPSATGLSPPPASPSPWPACACCPSTASLYCRLAGASSSHSRKPAGFWAKAATGSGPPERPGLRPLTVMRNSSTYTATPTVATVGSTTP